MPCACSKNRARTTGTGTPVPSGTFRVMVNGRQVFETTEGLKAEEVSARFASATVLKPGETA